MIASAAASSWTIPPKSTGAAAAPVKGAGPPEVNQRKAAAAPWLKLLSTRWQQVSWAVRISRCRSRVVIFICGLPGDHPASARRSTASQSRPGRNLRQMTIWDRGGGSRSAPPRAGGSARAGRRARPCEGRHARCRGDGRRVRRRRGCGSRRSGTGRSKRGPRGTDRGVQGPQSVPAAVTWRWPGLCRCGSRGCCPGYRWVAEINGQSATEPRSTPCPPAPVYAEVSGTSTYLDEDMPSSVTASGAAEPPSARGAPRAATPGRRQGHDREGA